MADSIKARGTLNIDHITNGKVNSYYVPNTVVTLGKSIISSRLISGAYAPTDSIGWMSIGTGSSPIAAGDTTLGTEYMRLGPGSVTGSTTTTATTNDTSQWIGSFGVDAVTTVNEAGLFNASGVDLGSMLSRTTFADISAISGDQINVSWKVDFS